MCLQNLKNAHFYLLDEIVSRLVPARAERYCKQTNKEIQENDEQNVTLRFPFLQFYQLHTTTPPTTATTTCLRFSHTHYNDITTLRFITLLLVFFTPAITNIFYLFLYYYYYSTSPSNFLFFYKDLKK